MIIIQDECHGVFQRFSVRKAQKVPSVCGGEGQEGGHF